MVVHGDIDFSHVTVKQNGNAAVTTSDACDVNDGLWWNAARHKHT